MRTVLAFLAAMLLLAILFTAQLSPASPLFWEASLSPAVMALRIGLVLTLVWFLVCVPEAPGLRIAVGLSASLLAAWIVVATYTGSLGFVDVTTLFPPVMAVAVALLDSKPDDEPFQLFSTIGTLQERGAERLRMLVVWGAQLGWLLHTDIRLTIDDFTALSADVRPLSYPGLGPNAPMVDEGGVRLAGA